MDAGKLYELPTDDPAYIAQALIPALSNLRGLSLLSVKAHHKLENYHEKLAALGFADPRQN